MPSWRLIQFLAHPTSLRRKAREKVDRLLELLADLVLKSLRDLAVIGKIPWGPFNPG
jgi:hypothetical protein